MMRARIAGGTGKNYLADLTHELSVLRGDTRREILADLTDHVSDFATTDEPPDDVIGRPAVIARTALEDIEGTSRFSPRPSFAMDSKRLQLAATLIYGIPIVLSLALGFSAGAEHGIGALITGIPLIALFIAPLVVRWRSWAPTSTICLVAFVAFLVVSVVVTTTDTSVSALGAVFLLSWPMFVLTGVIPVALLTAALFRAPKVLRTR